MAVRRHRKQRTLLRQQVDNLRTPAEAHDTPFLHILGVSGFEGGKEGLDSFFGGAGRGGAGEEVTENLLLFVRVWWVDGDGESLAVEEVGHVDAVLVGFVRVGEDVGALEGLGGEAEDVEDDEDGGVGIRGAGDVCVGVGLAGECIGGWKWCV